jgi:hypothetical protein
LLAHIPLADMPAFLEFALGEAQKTRFDLQTLGGVRQYVNGYLQARGQQAAARTAAAAREARERAEERETAVRIEYDRFRRAEIDRLFSRLSAEEQAAIEALARATTLPGGRSDGPLAQILFGKKRAQITAERHSHNITSFEHWSAAHA